MKAMPRMSGIITLWGSFRSCTRGMANGRLMMTRMMLPMRMEAMTPHAISGYWEKRIGPGLTPSIISAPSMTAVVPEPGMPSVSSGTIAPAAQELFAASGAASPSMAPLPNFSGVLLRFFSIAYDMKVAMLAPIPGSTPTKKPRGELRSMGMMHFLNCGQLTHTLPMLFESRLYFVSRFFRFLKTSQMA